MYDRATLEQGCDSTEVDAGGVPRVLDSAAHQPAIVVRAANAADAGQIAALRHAYYAARGADEQIRDDVVWTVACIGERVVACQSHQDVGYQRWQMDCYRERGRWGTIGVLSLMDFVESEADLEGKMLIGITEIDNDKNIAGALGRKWRVLGLALYRPIGGE